MGECGYQSYTGKAEEFNNIQNVSSKKHNGRVVGCERGSVFFGRIDLEKITQMHVRLRIFPVIIGKNLQCRLLYCIVICLLTDLLE